MSIRIKITAIISALLAVLMLAAGCAHPWRVSGTSNTEPPVEESVTPEPAGSPEPTGELTVEPVGTEIPVVPTDVATDEPATDNPTQSGSDDTAAPVTDAVTASPTEKPTAAPTEAPKPTDTPTPAPTQAPVSSDFAQFSSPSVNGTGNFSNASFAGAKLTIVNFWSTTCAPCIKEMPELQKISQEYASKGLKIVTILFDSETPGAIQTALSIFDSIKVTLPLIRCNSSISDAIVKPYGVAAMPSTFFVDSNGHILQRVNNANTYEEWVSLINGFLK